MVVVNEFFPNDMKRISDTVDKGRSDSGIHERLFSMRMGKVLNYILEH